MVNEGGRSSKNLDSPSALLCRGSANSGRNGNGCPQQAESVVRELRDSAVLIVKNVDFGDKSYKSN